MFIEERIHMRVDEVRRKAERENLRIDVAKEVLVKWASIRTAVDHLDSVPAKDAAKAAFIYADAFMEELEK